MIAEYSAPKTLHLLFSELWNPLLRKKDELPEKCFAADPEPDERLKYLTVKLLNHEIVLWYFVLRTLEIASV